MKKKKVAYKISNLLTVFKTGKLNENTILNKVEIVRQQLYSKTNQCK